MNRTKWILCLKALAEPKLEGSFLNLTSLSFHSSTLTLCLPPQAVQSQADMYVMAVLLYITCIKNCNFCTRACKRLVPSDFYCSRGSFAPSDMALVCGVVKFQERRQQATSSHNVQSNWDAKICSDGSIFKSLSIVLPLTFSICGRENIFFIQKSHFEVRFWNFLDMEMDRGWNLCRDSDVCARSSADGWKSSLLNEFTGLRLTS